MAYTKKPHQFPCQRKDVASTIYINVKFTFALELSICQLIYF